VLYDNTGAAADTNAMYAIATGNLLTHFGKTELKPVADYTDAMVENYDAAVYIGADHRVPLPQAFLDDVRSTDKPVMWLGRNIEALAGPDDAQNAQFRDKYGWDPRAATTVDSSKVTSVEYQGEKVHRETQGAPGGRGPGVQPEGPAPRGPGRRGRVEGPPGRGTLRDGARRSG